MSTSNSQKNEYGPQGLSRDDREFKGTTYAEVKNAMFQNPYQKIWGEIGQPEFPIYPVSWSSLFQGTFLHKKKQPEVLRQASERTVDSQAVLRWGPDNKGFTRLLHPNGAILFGTWEITEDNKFSGYFSKGSKGLIISRYSTGGVRTLRGQKRTQAMTGMIFPTQDENYTSSQIPATFFTQDDLGEGNSAYINDVELKNAPNITLLRRGLEIPIPIRLKLLFDAVDKEASVRQVYTIAELGKNDGVKTVAPKYMRLMVSSKQPKIDGKAIDFRDEIMSQIYDQGNPEPQRTLKFDISVSDEGRKKGLLKQRHIVENWECIGSITFTEAVVSKNGDKIIHFQHPPWRDDRNDPSTTIRVGVKRVRK